MTSTKMEYLCQICYQKEDEWGKLIWHTADVHVTCLLCREKFSSAKKAHHHLHDMKYKVHFANAAGEDKDIDKYYNAYIEYLEEHYKNLKQIEKGLRENIEQIEKRLRNSS